MCIRDRYEGEVLLARWVPDIQEPAPESEASSTVGGDTWRNGAENGGFDESFVLKQAQTLLYGREEDVDVELGAELGPERVNGAAENGGDSGASSVPSSAAASPRPSATIVRRRRPPARRAIDALRAHKNRPFYRTASLANLLNAGEENAAVNAKIVKIKEALEKLVLHRAPPRDGEKVGEYEGEVPVSYTHLTLPTILRV